ncbi:MAG: hypothetical protein AAF488_03595 [Planctomycetota bacterium]
MRALATVIAVATCATSAFVTSTDASPVPGGVVPTRVLLHEDFELGDLEDPALPSIERIEEYLQSAWEPVFEGYPKFMTPSLERIAGSIVGPQGRRFLRYPVRSGDAAIRGPSFSLKPWMQLRVAADLRWKGLGNGSIHVGIVYSDGTRVPFVTGSGADRTWSRLSGENVVPGGVEFGRVEVWIDGDHTRNQGEHGIDNIRVEILPRLSLRSAEKVRRINPGDDRPFLVETVGFPPGEYDLELVLRNRAGVELLRLEQHKFVRLGRQIDFRPRVLWPSEPLPRGLYTAELIVRGESGWSLEDRGEFVLAGRALFEPSAGLVRWGIATDPTAAEPAWFSVLGPARNHMPFLIEIDPRDDLSEVPDWIGALGSHRRAMAIQSENGWDEATIGALLPLRTQFPRWYWMGAKESADPFFEQLAKEAPFLRTGRRVSPREVAALGERRPLIELPGRGRELRKVSDLEWERESFDVLIDGADLAERSHAADELATLLYLTSARAPQAVFLAEAEKLFVEKTARGDWIPRPALLAWEFVTRFLAGADFEREEKLGRGTFLAYRRDGEPYLVAIPDGAQTLEVFGQLDGSIDGVEAYGPMGDVERFARDELGRVKIELGGGPVLLRGVDLPKMRTLHSLAIARRAAGEGAAGTTPLTLTVSSGYREPVKIAFDARYPEGWPGRPDFDPQSVVAGATGEWGFDVEIPVWAGLGGDRSLAGDLVIEVGNRTERVPFKVDMPTGSTRLGVTRVDGKPNDATVEVENTSGERLRITVYLEIEPDGRRRRFGARWLNAGEKARYALPASGISPNAELLFSAIIENDGEQVHRTLEL